MFRHPLVTLLCTGTLLFACDGRAPLTSTSTQGVMRGNSPELNGAKLNGAKLNGAKLNGAKLNGAKLNGAKLNGANLNGAKLNGASLVALTSDGAELEGDGLVGVELEGQLSDGNVLPLRIDDARRGYGSNADIVYYAVSYFDGDAWQPLCGRVFGYDVPALALRGTWNLGIGVPGGGSHSDDGQSFTLACRTGALAKCAEWGYKPWATAEQCQGGVCSSVSLAGHHQACTRMVRADYCGDGRPWTFTGTAINVYDGVGLNRDTERWTFEAEWRPGGAACLRSTRAATGVMYNQMPSQCVQRLVSRNCGNRSNFASGTLLMSEYYIWWVNTGYEGEEIYHSYDPYEE